ncbi:MAG: hypothetical protein IIT47_03725, partial [Oscillospiraceae bacterium]|nr:hypothetical protein [Oscillospiraceae bacterium]
QSLWKMAHKPAKEASEQMCSEAFLIGQCRALLQALFSGSGLGGRAYSSTLFFFSIPKHQAEGQISIAVKRSLFGGSTPFFSCKKEKNGVENRFSFASQQNPPLRAGWHRPCLTPSLRPGRIS